MGRPTKAPRAWWDATRGEWCILDRGDKLRLGLGRDEEAAALVAVAEYVVAQSKAAKAAPKGRDVDGVDCAEVLDRYLARRSEEDGKPAKKPVARPRELEQRIGKLAAFWAGRRVSEVDEETCEAFAEFVGSPSYARRCLGDFQAALHEARRATMFRAVVQVTMPPPPAPREDHLTVAEAVALVRVCWRHRDTQQRRIGGKFVKLDGVKTLVGGELAEVVGAKRPWWHVGRFVIAAIATCSRSSRIFEASYRPEEGRPWMDLDKGVLYRQPPGARKTKKRAPTVDVAERLVAAMRRWSSDRVVNGVAVPGDQYVVQWQGKAADPKGAFTEAVNEARRQYPHLFLREDGVTPKQVVRHTLRHTGVTWLSETPGVTVEDICSYAGMTRAMYDRVYGHAHRARSRKVVAAQARKGRPIPAARKADDDEGDEE